MALYHKWGVKTGFTFALQFFMLYADSLGGVSPLLQVDIQQDKKLETMKIEHTF